jgi:type I site-specific restriction endonuclease
MNEADTCRTYVLPKLESAGWEDEYISKQMVLTPGRIVPIGDRHTRKEGLRPDYVLFLRDGHPIAVVEAKAEYKHPADGLQQARQYAELMQLKFGVLGEAEYKKTVLTEGDILVVRTNGSKDLVGRCAVVHSLLEPMLRQHKLRNLGYFKYFNPRPVLNKTTRSSG